mmetsp:Transcript_131120/g.298513  ORF Transcript_131120/g.298513 Transcript_131120/m.298513 type:complete len:256 (+) Transcript_131120:121-888(+)
MSDAPEEGEAVSAANPDTKPSAGKKKKTKWTKVEVDLKIGHSEPAASYRPAKGKGKGKGGKGKGYYGGGEESGDSKGGWGKGGGQGRPRNPNKGGFKGGGGAYYEGAQAGMPEVMFPGVGMGLVPGYMAPMPFGMVGPAGVAVDVRMVKQLVRQQMEYYFSPQNLPSDIYLQSQMDSDQWVPLSVLCGFPRIRELTQQRDIVVQALGDSQVLELGGEEMDKVRLKPKTEAELAEGAEEAKEEESPPADQKPDEGS